jgi:hypothetical protein
MNSNPPSVTADRSYYDYYIFLVEDILLLPNLENIELSIFTSASLCSMVYNYPSFKIGEHHTQTDLVEFYHSTSDPRYKLFQILIDGLKRKGVNLYWLQSPIFFGQL